jgi:hypothetical protein
VVDVDVISDAFARALLDDLVDGADARRGAGLETARRATVRGVAWTRAGAAVMVRISTRRVSDGEYVTVCFSSVPMIRAVRSPQQTARASTDQKPIYEHTLQVDVT